MDSQNTNVITVSWDKDAVWVQQTSYLMLEETLDGEPENVDGRDSLRLRRQNGETFVATRQEIDADYEPVHDAFVFRPRHNPAQMLRFNDDATVVFDHDKMPVRVRKNSVLLRSADGQVTQIDDHTFRCNYAIVAAANAEPLL